MCERVCTLPLLADYTTYYQKTECAIKNTACKTYTYTNCEAQCRKKSKYQQQQKAIHKTHVTSGICLSKRKLFLISALIGRYVTLL